MNNININDKRRVMLDLDGTICYTKKEHEKYEDVLPLPGAVEFIQELKKKDYYIIICTARNMRTYEHNIGIVNAKQTKIIVDWFNKWQIPFDEIWNKPHYYIAFDDKTKQFASWEQVKNDIKEFENTEGIK